MKRITCLCFIIFLMTFPPAILNAQVLSKASQSVEDEIKASLSTHTLDKIEGIYKRIDAPNDFYRIGIVKTGDVYKATVIENNSGWFFPGDTKAIIEDPGTGNFAVRWTWTNLKDYELIGHWKSEGVLLIPFPKAEEDIELMKVYPKIETSTQPKKVAVPPIADLPSKTVVASGSGFMISANGYVATNAHVISGAKRITVDLLNNLGTMSQYEAKAIVIDSANDVAIIKITDQNFKPFARLPYVIETKANVGASVFTIGFPLNSVMGENYKVANGIISSNTGIQDDIRFYQITVPIQPGNSGGPLFNKNGNIIGLTSSRLNEDYVGTHVENVNFAVKSMYLLTAINAIDQFPTSTGTSSLAGKSLEDQISVLKKYICLIKIY